MRSQPGFFDLSERYESLSEHNDPLEKLNEAIDWSIFVPLLRRGLKKRSKGRSGRKGFPLLLMFKILVLQSLYNLSDEQAEYQIRDRLSFMRFLGLSFEDKVPDEKTIWLFREKLREANLYEKLFKQFDGYLHKQGYCARKGTVVDASLMPARIQRNNDDETAVIKEGCVPVDWMKRPHKMAQKDLNARWVMKDRRAMFGYKDHVAIDVEHKLIRAYEVTDAALHDSHCLPGLVKRTNNTSRKVYADRAYRDHGNRDWLLKHGYERCIPHQRAPRGSLTVDQKRYNKRVSRTRIRVEHVFGFMKQSMHQRLIRSVGMARARAKIGLMNLVYNLCRYEQLQRASCT